MRFQSRIYVAGHRGMVGSAIVRRLQGLGYTNIILKNSKELDLRNQGKVNEFFHDYKPEFVFLAAAKVGGIMANNTMRGDFIYDNLMIQTNVIKASYENNVQKLIFLGSSCIYPKFALQPIKEEYLLSGHLEKTNQPYAIAKIAGIELCASFRDQYSANFISAMPTNLYGPNDNYDLQTSHVLPALVRKFITATKHKKTDVTVWGTGTPRREFLHVDDLADASIFLMLKYNDGLPINVGTGTDLSIMDLAQLIANKCGFEGQILWDDLKPDGTLRKLLDVSRINALGWRHKIDLEQGIEMTINETKTNNW